MITQQQFNGTMKGLYSLLPFAKALPPEAVNLAWNSFPDQAKREMTPAMLEYAAAQLLLDTQPEKESPPHLAILRYVYRVGDGVARLDWGLKEDLRQRMARPGVFNPQPRSEAEQFAAGELPALDGRRSEPQGVLAKLAGGAL